MNQSAEAAAKLLIERQDQCAASVRRLLAVQTQGGKNSRGRDAIRRSVNSETISRFGQTLSRYIFETALLQTKARRKFDAGLNADQNLLTSSAMPLWWVTERSLQQATPWQVARLKAGWLAVGDIYDLCCGIGGDSMEFCRRHRVVAVDRDPILVAMAQLNRQQSSLQKSSSPGDWNVRVGDVTEFAIPSAASIHVDPDRRAGAKALLGNSKGVSRHAALASQFSPSWEQVQKILRRTSSALVKLAPATLLDTSPLDRPTHRVWISLQGTVREQTLLVGNAVQQAGLPAGGRSAYRVAADGSTRRFLAAGEDDRLTPQRSSLGKWLIDPVSSVRAAGLTEPFAQVHQLDILGDPSGFLTCDGDCLPQEVSAMATVGQVVWSGSAADRRLRKELRSHHWFPETVKCRGVDRDPAELFRRYRNCGDTPVTLWIGRVGRSVFAAITRS